MDDAVIMRANARVVPAKLDHDALLSLAREKAPDPTVFDQYDAVFWRAQVSSNRLDFYATSMAETTLNNYVDDLRSGVSFLDSHDWRKNGWGQSIDGELVKSSEKIDVVNQPLREVHGIFFTLAGLVAGDQRTDDFIAAIRSGMWKDVSIGFYARDITCSICGKQSFEWWKEDGCMHLPGVEYEIEEGKSKRTLLAWASINDGRLMETSQVYDGATPDAEVNQVVVKANALSSERMLTEREISSVERRFAVRLVRPEPIVQLDRTMVRRRDEDMVAKKKVERAAEQDDEQTPVDPVVTNVEDDAVITPAEDETVIEQDDQAIEGDEVEVPEETVIDLPPVDGEDADDEDDDEDDDEGARNVRGRDVLAAERKRLADHGIKIGRDPELAVRALADALLAERGRNADLAKDADLGRRYRKDMIESAIAEGIRAKGDAFKSETYRSMLEKMSLDQIETIRDDFKAEADRVLVKTPTVLEGDRNTNGDELATRRKRGAHRA